MGFVMYSLGFKVGRSRSRARLLVAGSVGTFA